MCACVFHAKPDNKVTKIEYDGELGEIGAANTPKVDGVHQVGPPVLYAMAGKPLTPPPTAPSANSSKLITTDDIEVPDTSVSDFVLSKIEAYGDAVAMVDGPSGRELKYSEMKAKIRAVASGGDLRGKGCQAR